MLGLIIAAAGALLMAAPKLPWLGHLPGDIHMERENFSLHVPIVTCLVVSVLATLLLNWFLRR